MRFPSIVVDASTRDRDLAVALDFAAGRRFRVQESPLPDHDQDDESGLPKQARFAA
jgi:hypothetical protein